MFFNVKHSLHRWLVLVICVLETFVNVRLSICCRRLVSTADGEIVVHDDDVRDSNHSDDDDMEEIDMEDVDDKPLPIITPEREYY